MPRASSISQSHREMGGKPQASIGLKGAGLIVKGTGFSPYIKTPARTWASAPEGNAPSIPLQIKQLPQPLGLRPAHRNLRLLFIIHPQLIARLEPRHHLAD